MALILFKKKKKKKREREICVQVDYDFSNHLLTAARPKSGPLHSDQGSQFFICSFGFYK